MIIGTAGHVDHGKTTLVAALTGHPGDRLPEERRRGMTIDLGYAYHGAVGFIDVPGHERLVATMLAGAGGIDAALLAVAADDGVMPQTIEHVQVLDLLGIDRGVVAITRADRATPEQIEEVRAQVRALLAGTTLADAATLAVSAMTGHGVGALRAELDALGRRPRNLTGHARLAVDRAFTITGAGLVVTGTLVAGRIAVGDRLLHSPAGTEIRVRGLHAQNRPAPQAEAGQRVALNVVGVGRTDVARGDWVLHPALHAPTSLLDVRLSLLPGVAVPRDGGQVHVHLAAAHVTARFGGLADGYARLALGHAVGALAGDRFVLRDSAASRTLGGGVVLDPAPPRRGGRSATRLALLPALALDSTAALARMVADGPVALAAFLRARNVAEAGPVLAGAGAVAVAGHALTPASLSGARHAILAALATHHAAHPDAPGLPAALLGGGIAPRLPPPVLAELLAAALRRGEVQQDGPWLRLPSHRLVLSPQDERVWVAVRKRLAAERFRPPRTRDLAVALRVPEPAMRAALKRLARLGRIVEVAHDHFFLREVLAEIVTIAAAIEARDGEIVAGTLRDRLDNGRKVAIHLLEFFDATGLTRRTGDSRRLRRDRLALFGAAAP